MNEFYTGPIPNELWKPIRDNTDYWLSNYCRIHGISYEETFKQVESSGLYQRIDLKLS